MDDGAIPTLFIFLDLFENRIKFFIISVDDLEGVVAEVLLQDVIIQVKFTWIGIVADTAPKNEVT